MLRLNPGKIILLGCGLILCGVALALDGQPTVQAQPAQQDAAEYVGSQACASCHRELTNAHSASRHALALQDVETDKAAIRADFTTGQKERTVTFPGESTPRPFTADDIAYVVGSGRYVERYLYKVERNKYAVFPAEWNVAKKAWEPYIKGKVWPDPTYDWTENCAGCHTTGLGSRGRFKDAGVQCEACHGPGSIHAERADKIGESRATPIWLRFARPSCSVRMRRSAGNVTARARSRKTSCLTRSSTDLAPTSSAVEPSRLRLQTAPTTGGQAGTASSIICSLMSGRSPATPKRSPT